MNLCLLKTFQRYDINVRNNSLLLSLATNISTYIQRWIQIYPFRAQQDWAYEFPDRTGPDTQICRTGPAGPDWIRTYNFKFFTIKINKKRKNFKKFWKKKKKKLKKIFFQFFFDFISTFKGPESGKEKNRKSGVRTFENLPDFRTGRDVRLSPRWLET